ncbi:MAG: hypothetical protein QM703_26030 [Gemmatales bacterium]
MSPLDNLPRGFIVTHLDDGAFRLDYRYAGNWFSKIGLLFLFLFWSFFCYLVTGSAIQLWMMDDMTKFFSVLCFLFAPLMIFIDLAILYHILWLFFGRTVMEVVQHDFRLVYYHPLRTKTLQFTKDQITRLLQKAHRNVGTKAPFQRDLYLISSNRWPVLLLWREDESTIDWLGNLLAAWAGSKYETEEVIAAGGT